MPFLVTKTLSLVKYQDKEKILIDTKTRTPIIVPAILPILALPSFKLPTLPSLTPPKGPDLSLTPPSASANLTPPKIEPPTLPKPSIPTPSLALPFPKFALPPILIRPKVPDTSFKPPEFSGGSGSGLNLNAKLPTPPSAKLPIPSVSVPTLALPIPKLSIKPDLTLPRGPTVGPVALGIVGVPMGPISPPREDIQTNLSITPPPPLFLAPETSVSVAIE